ncbi:hypothetical protein HPB47_011939 [Ixodes persulcatus]|uniref:Uncharacterized protein n=1 Tax=Ixodes persulcatus TaxID=34615 RepID=A0AC60NUV2_IXOPE|nr:hypothetical protein HPB47_011939 [Ixodes persulcatus]
MCRILRSEWWQQVCFFRDCLRIACSRKPQQPEANIRFHDCSRTSMQLTEFLWNQVRPNLPSKKKQRVKEGTVLADPQVGPEVLFEPALKRVNKLALSRLVFRQVPEEDKLSGLRVLVSDKKGFFVIMPEDMFAEKATCAVQKNFKAVLERQAKVKERAVELLERLNLKHVVTPGCVLCLGNSKSTWTRQMPRTLSLSLAEMPLFPISRIVTLWDVERLA